MQQNYVDLKIDTRNPYRLELFNPVDMMHNEVTVLYNHQLPTRLEFIDCVFENANINDMDLCAELNLCNRSVQLNAPLTRNYPQPCFDINIDANGTYTNVRNIIYHNQVNYQGGYHINITIGLLAYSMNNGNTIRCERLSFGVGHWSAILRIYY